MELEKRSFPTKEALYEAVQAAAAGMLRETDDACAALANVSALLMLFLPDVSWTGFYLLKRGRLVLGPFQGRPAEAELPLGYGVCGTAAAERRTQIVADVSASEIAVPLLDGGALFGVLHIASRKPARFDEEDAAGLARLADRLCKTLF